MDSGDAGLIASLPSEAIGSFQSNEMQQGVVDENMPKLRKTWCDTTVTLLNGRMSKEFLTTMFADEENAMDCVDKLMEENITCRDLAALTDKDLELLGIKNAERRADLLECFKLLPNQDPTYDSILEMCESDCYNREIMEKATDHLETMRSAIAAITYKLQINPPDDVLIGDNNYASRFVMETMREVDRESQLVGAEIEEMEKYLKIAGKLVTNGERNENGAKRTKNEKGIGKIIAISSTVGIIALVTYYYFKYNKN